MFVCDERGREAREGGGGQAGAPPPPRASPPAPPPPPALITHMHGCLLSRCMRTDRLVDEDGHGEVDRQYDPNSVDELNMP